jgi:methionyl-tRNA formyltransferase
VFFGTPEYAVPTLDRLALGPHEVVAVVSQPDRRRGRGRARHPSPVATRALELELPLLRPERVGAVELAEALAAYRPDIGVVVAFGQFIPRRIRELPTRGFLINGHASLLPKFRGAAPIQHAILAGDDETGVCVMRVEKAMDAGPVALVRRIPIGPDEDAGSLGERLSRLSAEAIAEGLDLIERGEVSWTEQDPSAATLAPKIETEDARLDWSRPASELVRLVRAMAPSPGAFCVHQEERIRVLAARSEDAPAGLAPGTVSYDDTGALRIATAKGFLYPLSLQRPGKKAMATADFLRGHPLSAGTRLGADSEVP